MQIKKTLAQVAPYAPGRPIDEIKRQFGLSEVVKLASNENPLGASPKALVAAGKAMQDVFMYPDPNAYSLRQALASHLNLQPENFIFGTGSDGLIELVCKTFLAEGDESIMPDPSFSLYELNVLANGATPVKVALNKNMQYNPEMLLSAITPKTKVIWLCNPNNPTGGMYTEKEQLSFFEKVPENVLVVVDEAYYEYAAGNADYPNSLALLKDRKNILILRTFSKIYGLAGLRVGYGIGDSHLLAELEKARPPFNVCSPALAAAEAALEDEDFLNQSLKANKEGKKYLEEAFTEMGLPFVKTSTNFIAVDTKKDAKTVYEALLTKGYIVKGGHVLGMPGYLRVTIGTLEECKGFVEALSSILQTL
ncbi:MAG: histidinol-phosphate transaminase [Clostridia bacterium]|nr:histidinol-phosphate transaminase [Clostridia bacterium]